MKYNGKCMMCILSKGLKISMKICCQNYLKLKIITRQLILWNITTTHAGLIVNQTMSLFYVLKHHYQTHYSVIEISR